MVVLQVLQLLILTTSLVQTKDLPCNEDLTIDITNGTRNNRSEIVFNGDLYTPNNYYILQNGSEIRGCLCDVTDRCVRKCCPPGFGHNGKECSRSNLTSALNFDVPVYEEKDSVSTPEKFKYVYNYHCPHDGYILDVQNFPEDDNYLQVNGTLFMPSVNDGEPNLRLQHEFCVDVNVTSGKFITILCFADSYEPMDTQKVYSIGMLISMPFLLLTFLVYACVPDLQNIHGKCLMCYVINLLTAYLFLVCIQLDTSNTSTQFCIIAPFIIYFSFMVSFMWLDVMCIDIWWTFSGFRGYKGTHKSSERRRFLLYSLYAWGIPLIMLAVTLGLQFAEEDMLPSWVVKPHIGEQKCWFPDDKSVGYYFYGPILAIILINLVLFTYTTFKIWMVQRSTDESMKCDSQRHGSESDKQRYKLYLKLMLVFGVNWLMEIISWLASGPQWLWYVTDMCNAMYGVFIFFIFVCKANVWKLVQKRYHVIMGRPYFAQTFAPTSSTRSTALSASGGAGAGQAGHDSFALTTSTAT